MLPAPPSNITVTPITSRSIYVAWQPPQFTGYTNITSYIVELVENVSTHSDFILVDARNHSLHLSTLKPFTWYYVGMRAVNQIGRSGFGDVIRVQTLPEGTVELV